MLKKGSRLELLIESAAFEGKAVARHDGLVVFVPNAVPGDRVQALIVSRRKKYAEARISEILEPSPFRVEPRCVHSGVCGGCRWQNFDYAQQLVAKHEQVTELMSRIGRIDGVDIAPTLPAPEPFYYRNKMEFSFGTQRWLTEAEIQSGKTFDRSFALGLHVPKRFDRILDLSECHLQSPETGDLLDFVRALCAEQGWSPYDSRCHEGFLRNLVIRNGKRTGQLMVVLVTNGEAGEAMKAFSEQLRRRFPAITTFVNAINDTRSPVASGREIVYYGDGSITEILGGLEFVVSAKTFFQPNTLQAERLYSIVAEFAQLAPGDVVYDLYCGVGSIGLFLSGACSTVIGVEEVGPSVDAARANAARNSVTNCTFYHRRAERGLQPDLTRRHGTPHAVIVDPPRAGLSTEMISALNDSEAPRVVYISCNPATQARDLNLLAGCYRVEKMQPVDMFPHTSHIECVAVLKRKQTT